MSAHIANVAISLFGKDPCYSGDDFHPYKEGKIENQQSNTKPGVQIVSAEEMRALWQSQFPKKA